MRGFSPDFIERVRLANDIVDIIGEDTFLKRSGVRYMGLCPFPGHNEKTPSFSVSSDQQLYHCFGCGQSGNIFTYLSVRRGLLFREAVKNLAQRAGIPLPAIGGDRRQDMEKDSPYLNQQRLLKINLFACNFYEKALHALSDSHPVKRYLKQRDISDETVKKFRLGYAPAGWDGLSSHIKKGDVSLALQLGLIKKKGEDRYYDFFRNRLMFPVFAQNGRDVLGFGGRTLEENQPKYINSQDSVIFHKGRIFYGWHFTASFIRNSGKALVVEGYTDFLSLIQRGVRNGVATLGTALTEDHARWLSRYTDQVILSFDGDSAGKKAAERSLGALLFYGLAPKILKLEEGMDPDSFIRERGKEVFQKKVDSAQDLFLYLFLAELKKYPAGVDRFSLIQKIADLLAQTKKGVLRDYYTNRFLDSFGFDEKVARKVMEEILRKKQLKAAQKAPYHQKTVSVWDRTEGFGEGVVESKQASEGEVGENISLQSAPKAELYLLILALQNQDYYQQIVESGVIKNLRHSGVIQLFELIDEYSHGELKCFEALNQVLSTHLSDPRALQRGQYPALTCLVEEKVHFFIQDCVNKVEKEKKRLNLRSITADMRLDTENVEKYLIKIAEWTKKSKIGENEL